MDEHNPYSAPDSRLETAVPDGELQLADRWHRLGAFFIDVLIGAPLIWGLLFATGSAREILQLISHGARASRVWNLEWAMIGFALYCLVQAYPLAKSGQSWGKRALKMKIVDLDGRKPSLAKLLFVRYGTRTGAALIPFVGGLLVLVDDLFIFREDRRCIHDHIAGTRVVMAEPKIA